MICPNNGNKDFDDLLCRDCKWFMQCLKVWQDGNIWGKDETLGDNFPSFIINGECKNLNNAMCNLGYACDSCPYNKQKSPTDTEKMMINSLAQEIKEFGEEWVWNNINMIIFEKRLDYIEMFISAKRLLEKGEY